MPDIDEVEGAFNSIDVWPKDLLEESILEALSDGNMLCAWLE